VNVPGELRPEDALPPVPRIEEGLLEQCRADGDYAPILFRWYQYVGLTCNFFTEIRRDSDGIREIPALHYAVLIGLLNRCARLMLANTALSHQGLFGETTAILDRCIFESVVKIKWLCTRGDAASFDRLLLDGLKSDVEFKRLILKNVADRGGATFPIETRMLASIDATLETIPTTEAVVMASPPLPDVASLIAAIGGDRIVYVIGQRLGSHAVHGTWPSLRRDYLEDHDGVLGPRDHDCPTHPNQYVFVMLWVLGAIESFLDFAFEAGEGRETLRGWLDSVRVEVLTLNAELVGNDFENDEGV
jgi:hypothetical protein